MADQLPGIVLDDNTTEAAPINQGISLDAERPAISAAGANSMAEKWDYGLKEDSPGLPVLQDNIENNQGTYDRQRAAILETSRRNQLRQQTILDIAKNPSKYGPNAANMVYQMAQEDFTDPGTVMEKLYARRLVNDAATTPTDDDGNTVFNDAFIVDPEGGFNLLDRSEALIQKQEIARSIYKELEAEYQQRSTVGNAIEFAASLVPFYSTIAQMNMVKDAPKSSWIPGESKNEQFSFLYNLPPDEFNKVLRQVAFGPNPSRDVTQILQFVGGLMHYSVQDENLDNLVAAADFTVFSGVAGKAMRPLYNTARDVVKANAFDRMNVPMIQEATGRIDTAMHTRVVSDFNRRAASSGSDVREIQGNTTSIFDPSSIMVGSQDRLSVDAAQKLEAEVFSRGTNLIDTFNNIRVTRIDRNSDALKTMIDEATPRFTKVYSKTKDAIADVSLVSKDDTFNVDFVKFSVGKLERNAPEVAARKVKPEGEAAMPANQAKKIAAAEKKLEKAQKFLDSIDKLDAKYKDAAKIVRAAKSALNKAKKPQDTKIMAKVSMTKPNATLFETKQAAERAAVEDYGLPKGSFSTEERGAGHYITYLQPLDEVSTRVRDQLVKDTTATTPRNFRSMFVDMLRTPDELMAKNIVREAKSIYNQSTAVGAIKEAIAPIGKLSRKEAKEWDDFTRYEMDHTNMYGERGRFSRNVGELISQWRDFHGKPPTDRQVRAYFAYTQTSDFNFAAYNIGIWAAKNRVGLRNVHVPLMTDAGNLELKVEGQIVDRIPWSSKANRWDRGILFWDGENPGRMMQLRKGAKRNGPPVYENYYREMYASPAEVEAKIKTGKYTIVRLSKYGQDALTEHGFVNKMIPGQVDYLLVKNPKLSNLELQQIPYRPGGHVEHTHHWYLRQGNISKSKIAPEREGEPEINVNTWYGDVNIAAVSTEKQGRILEPLYNQAREMLREAKALRSAKQPGQAALKEKQLKDFVNAKLPYNYSQWVEMFYGNPKTGKKAYLNIDEPIHLTPKDQSTYKAGKHNHLENLRNIHDAPDNPYNQNIDLSFGMERGENLHRVTMEGSVNNPVFKLSPVRQLDAASMIDRTAARLVRSLYVNDFKTKMAEQFVQEFGHLMNKDMQALRDNPVAAIIDPPFKNGLAGPDYVAARKASIQAKEWFHIKDPWERETDSYRKSILEAILNKNEEAGRWIEPWLLHRAKDPADFMKSFAFHMNILSPHQLLLQSMSMVNIAAIEGLDAAGRGASISWFHHAMRKAGTDEVRKGIAARASKFGISAEEFLKSDEALHRSGFWRVGHEVNWDVGNDAQTVVTGTWGRIKDVGRWFFDQGERNARYASWATAYNKWRAANPKGVLSDQAIAEIRDRADFYMGRMSSASNAAWQNNAWTKVPTQFWSYPIRLAEAFYGRELNSKERWRMLLTYGAAFGFPSTIGLVAPVTPAHEMVRSYQLQYPDGILGSPVPESTIAQVWNQGLLGYLTTQLTGSEQNIGEKFGTGMSFVDDIIDGDKNVVQAYLGASGTVWGNVLTASEPFGMALLGIFTGNHYPIKKEDMIAGLRTQSGFNDFYKLTNAIMYGQYYSRRGDYQGEVSAAEGLGMFALGTLPQRQADAYKILNNQKDLRKYQFEKRQEAIQNIRRGIRAESPDDTVEFFKRASHAMQTSIINPMDYIDIMQEALKPAEIRDAAHQVAAKMKNATPAQKEAWSKIFGQGNF